MAILDILCFNLFNLKNKIIKIEHKKIFRGPWKILKNISWPINISLKYFMTPTKTLQPPPPHPPSYILNVRSLNWLEIFRAWFSDCLKAFLKRNDLKKLLGKLWTTPFLLWRHIQKNPGTILFGFFSIIFHFLSFPCCVC